MEATKNTVMIVDDDLMNLRALMEILGNDYTVYAEREGKNCLEAAARLQPDLILLDVIMPGLSGFEVIKLLKGDSRTRDIPIIFVTGLANADDEIRGFSHGAVDYINKPFNSHVVEMRVHHQIKIVNLIREIQNISITDTLTGIGNRRYFNTLLEQEWERAKRQQTTISFMILDIDNFKQLNDTYGHVNGDVALQSVARVISQVIVRATDKFARWGGEEFAIILPETVLAGACKVAEDVRFSVENTNLEFDKTKSCRITVSIGIHSVIPGWNEGCSIDELISDADRALYHAKETGKNRVCTVKDLDGE